MKTLPALRRFALIGLTLTALTLALLTLPSPAPAQWTNDPWNGMVPVCIAEGYQASARIIHLSSDLTLITWVDERNSSLGQAYYQILNSAGVPLLQPNGNLIFNCNWQTGAWFLVTDGEGGGIAVLVDDRNGTWQVYGQRFDSLGNRLWGDRGLPLVIWPGFQDVTLTDVNADSFGNFFISWTYLAGTLNLNAYTQKFNQDGIRIWGDYGVPVCTANGHQDWQKSVSDEQGGIIVVWEDDRTTPFDYYLYAQHLDANGNPLWATNGIQLFNPQSGQPLGVNILAGGVPDGSGGGIWSHDTYWNWFLFRLSGTGHMEWLDIFSLPDTCFANPPLRHPTDGSIWISNNEIRSGQGWSWYLYRFNLAGTPLFGTTGLSLGGILSPTQNGVIAVRNLWHGSQSALRGTRVDSSGVVQWNANLNLWNGSFLWNDLVCAPDGQDGLVCAWTDQRNWSITGNDIYAQRLRADGSLGSPTPHPPEAPDWPRFEISMIGHTLHLSLPESGTIELALYNLLGQKVRTLLQGQQPAGLYDLSLDEKGLPAGIYFLNLKMIQGQQTLKIAIVK